MSDTKSQILLQTEPQDHAFLLFSSCCSLVTELTQIKSQILKSSVPDINFESELNKFDDLEESIATINRILSPQESPVSKKQQESPSPSKTDLLDQNIQEFLKKQTQNFLDFKNQLALTYTHEMVDKYDGEQIKCQDDLLFKIKKILNQNLEESQLYLNKQEEDIKEDVTLNLESNLKFKNIVLDQDNEQENSYESGMGYGGFSLQRIDVRV